MEEKITEYYCSKCGTQVKQLASYCSKCKQILATDGATKSKIVSRKKHFDKLEKENPSFKLKKWYHWVFYILGWANMFSLLFWITLWIVNSKVSDRYNKFLNPSVKKAIYIWGIFTIILYSFLILII